MASLKERLFANRRDLLLSRAYRSVFGERGRRTKDQEMVVADLMNFSKLLQSSVAISKATGSVDPLATMLAEGRREVAHRIINFTTLDDAQIILAIQQLNEALNNDV
ncbi:GTP-binding protein [Chimaeribacter arupi]|uniref:Bbp19 family protein n=1 Tax=Chimaeribacter arupi TaxID=2060066 RepID=UPI00271213E6|nr:GTP-binding protein [Chimaeribacter arupi]WKZ93615.1 GTP-binding protein [Chimaeribacter arupi]